MKKKFVKFRGLFFFCFGCLCMYVWIGMGHEVFKTIGEICLVPVIEHLFEIGEL